MNEKEKNEQENHECFCLMKELGVYDTNNNTTIFKK